MANQLYHRTESDPAIQILWKTTIVYTRLFHGLRVLAPSQLPASGPAIVVCNHTSGLDPLLIQAASHRLIRWMMAREYFEMGSLRWFFRAVGVILVDRDKHDLAATRAALRALQAGYVLGIFPEGRIETGDELLEFQSGAAALALKTGVAVHPAFLDGRQRGRRIAKAFVLPARARIAFGPPIQFQAAYHGPDAATSATQKIREAMLSLRTQAQSSLSNAKNHPTN